MKGRNPALGATPSWKTEALGGATTFLTMAYIVVLNPAILSSAGTGIPESGALAATVLLCFSMTLLMGLYAKLPFGVAPGMGINAFFTYQLILGQHIPWPVALGVVFWSGVLFLLVSLTPLRQGIARAIPLHLRAASAVGIGMFLTFIGLKNAGLVEADPATFVRFGKLNPPAFAAVGGGLLATWLLRRRSPFAFMASIVAVTLVALGAGWVAPPVQWFAAPDFHSMLGRFDPWGALKLSLVPAMISLVFTDLFDSISTFVGVAQATRLLDDDGHPLHLREGLIVDAWATLLAGVFGTSSGTAYIESAAGIEAGARTGRASVVTAFLFLPCFFVAPLVGMVPAYATAPVLILVGALMFRAVGELRLEVLEDLVPAFLTILLIPLTFSITQGILWGFASHGVLYGVVGRRREVSPAMWAIAALSIALLVFEHGKWA